jgi:two-component system chemotaxis response regulator CheY
MIVDDAPFIREVLSHIVTSEGLQVVAEAKDGTEVLPAARQAKPDVILMDIVMPGKSGIDATKEVLAEFPDVKVVACSTLDQQLIVNKAIEAGCIDYITKPFEKAKVIASIKRAAELNQKEA